MTYRDKAEFFLVYIREAHPTDAKPREDGAPGGRARGPDIPQAKTLDERITAAAQCLKDLKLSLPTLLDDMAGTAEKAYGGWPDRMAVIDLDGKVAYQSGPGPAGFKPAAAEQALKDVLANGGRMPARAAAPEPPAPNPPPPAKPPQAARPQGG